MGIDAVPDEELFSPELEWTYDEMSRLMLERGIAALRGLATILDDSPVAQVVRCIADSIDLANARAIAEMVPVDGGPH